MLSITNARRYYLYRHATDMRKGFDGLSGLVSDAMRQNPLSGDVFIFIGKSGRQIKLLLWEKDGFSIYSKRLEAGTYERPKGEQDTLPLSHDKLMLLLSGINIDSARWRKRFSMDEYSKKYSNNAKKSVLI